jgi:hypothetical protein
MGGGHAPWDRLSFWLPTSKATGLLRTVNLDDVINKWAQVFEPISPIDVEGTVPGRWRSNLSTDR